MTQYLLLLKHFTLISLLKTKDIPIVFKAMELSPTNTIFGLISTCYTLDGELQSSSGLNGGIAFLTKSLLNQIKLFPQWLQYLSSLHYNHYVLQLKQQQQLQQQQRNISNISNTHQNNQDKTTPTIIIIPSDILPTFISLSYGKVSKIQLVKRQVPSTGLFTKCWKFTLEHVILRLSMTKEIYFHSLKCEAQW
jgi:hypothetical protein